MNVIECADQLRSKGFKVYTWKPNKGTVEPDLVAKKYGHIFNVYLKKHPGREAQEKAYAKSHNALVIYMA